MSREIERELDTLRWRLLACEKYIEGAARGEVWPKTATEYDSVLRQRDKLRADIELYEKCLLPPPKIRYLNGMC